MSLSLVTPAPTTRLTTRAAVKAELGLTGTTDDVLIEDLIDRASAAIVSYCRRPFAREAVAETVPGNGDVNLMLSRTPIVAVSSVLFDSGVITDYSIADPDVGLLYRQAGWDWTPQLAFGLAGRQRWPYPGQSPLNAEEPRFTATYFGGFILPPQNRTGVTISAAASDNSINDSGDGFPAMLKAGDIVEVSGFVTAANNGRFLVAGTPTKGKIALSAASATLVNEAVGPNVTVKVSTLPADVEKAAIQATKDWFLSKDESGNVAEKQVGGLRLRFNESSDVYNQPLPPLTVGLLSRWVRSA